MLNKFRGGRECEQRRSTELRSLLWLLDVRGKRDAEYDAYRASCAGLVEMTAIAELYGVRDQHVAQACDAYEIARPRAGHWQRVQHSKMAETVGLNNKNYHSEATIIIVAAVGRSGRFREGSFFLRRLPDLRRSLPSYPWLAVRGSAVLRERLLVRRSRERDRRYFERRLVRLDTVHRRKISHSASAIRAAPAKPPIERVMA